MSARVLILGAGVCGLAAALRLLENDPTLDVTLLEQEERPGGLARSLTLNGQHTDLGPHRIFTELPDVQRFLEDIAGDEMETVTRVSRMWLKGGWIEYPPKPLEVAAHLGVGTLAGAGFSYLGSKAAGLFAAEGGTQESFESLMREAFGPALYELLVAPYTRKVWKVAPAELHADIARVRVSAGGLDQMVKKILFGEKPGQITAVKKFLYLPGGVETLVGKLRDGVERLGGKIRLVREVNALKEFRTGHLQVVATARDTGRQEVYQAESVVSTIPLPHLLGMLLPQKPDARVEKARAELRYITSILVCVQTKRPRVTDAQWLYFPGADTVFNRAYEPKNFHASMGTADQSMIVGEITCHPGDRIDGYPDRKLAAATLKGFARVGLVPPEDVAATLVHRIPMTYPIYDLDYRRRLSLVWRYLEQFPRLISAGRQGLYLHNNMDHSIHMGFRAAARLAETNANPAQAFYSEVRKFQKFRIVD